MALPVGVLGATLRSGRYVLAALVLKLTLAPNQRKLATCFGTARTDPKHDAVAWSVNRAWLIATMPPMQV